MLISPVKYIPKIIEKPEYFDNLKGYLDDKEAAISLAKFLRINLKFFVEILTGGDIQLQAFQVMTLKAMLNRNFSMCVWGRGVSKSWTAAMYCVLQCIFEPGSKIIIASSNFRSAKMIFNYIEKIVTNRNAKLLFDVFQVESKRGGNSDNRWSVNGGEIIAIPLSGDKIRGFRANILILDEFLLLPESVIENVLMPFLVSPQNLSERNKVREMEDRLVMQNLMKEEERMIFPNTSKMIALSSASYSFENLAKTYNRWNAIINGDEKDDISTYFTSQIAWNAVPEHMMDKAVIEMASNGGAESPSFLREYCGQFTDGTDGYYSGKKMFECTVPNGQSPHALIAGNSNKKYVLSIDPNFSNSTTADDFAMSLLELDEEREDSTLVHAYAVAGADITQHVNYIYYILTHFNVVLIICDNAGSQIVESCNASKIFLDNRIEVGVIDFKSTAKGIDYVKELLNFKSKYSYSGKVIAFKQVFDTEFIREANDRLQDSINRKKIWFASSLSAWGSAFSEQLDCPVNMDLIPYETKSDFAEQQGLLIERTKNQCSLIKIGVTAKGSLDFDLPEHAKRDRSEKRPRKDSYTSLLLGNWAAKIWFDLKRQQDKPQNITFVPRFVA